MSPEDLLNAKPTFASSVSLAGDVLTFPGDCVSKCVGLHACLWSERAREREMDTEKRTMFP